jgi:hypothetical protein
MAYFLNLRAQNMGPSAISAFDDARRHSSMSTGTDASLDRSVGSLFGSRPSSEHNVRRSFARIGGVSRNASIAASVASIEVANDASEQRLVNIEERLDVMMGLLKQVLAVATAKSAPH